MMKQAIPTMVLLSSVSMLQPPSAAEITCHDYAQQQYDHATALCKENANRIACSAYCNHQGVEEHGDSLITIDPQYRTKWDECYRKDQLPCEIARDYSRNQCLELALRRFQDHWNQCPNDPYVPTPPYPFFSQTP